MNNTKMVIIQIYTLTSRAELDEIEKFYEDLEQVLQSEKEYYTIIMGDFNA